MYIKNLEGKWVLCPYESINLHPLYKDFREKYNYKLKTVVFLQQLYSFIKTNHLKIKYNSNQTQLTKEEYWNYWYGWKIELFEKGHLIKLFDSIHFEYNYKSINNRILIILKELMENRFHWRNIHKFKDWGFNDEFNDEFNLKD